MDIKDIIILLLCLLIYFLSKWHVKQMKQALDIADYFQKRNRENFDKYMEKRVELRKLQESLSEIKPN